MGRNIMLITFLCFLTLPLMTSCGKLSSGFKTHTDSDIGISFEYPSDWEVKKTGNKLGIFNKKGDSYILFSSFWNIPKNEKASRAFDKAITAPYRKSFKIGKNLLDPPKRDISPEQLKMVTADRGYKGQFNGIVDGKKMVLSIALFLKGTNGYQVFSAIDESSFKMKIDEAVKILNSVKIIK